jgi:hypothetical protein
MYYTKEVPRSTLEFFADLKKTDPEKYTADIKSYYTHTLSLSCFSGLSHESIRVCADCWQVKEAERYTKPYKGFKKFSSEDDDGDEEEDEEEDEEDDDEEECENDNDQYRDLVNRDAVAACRCGMSADYFAESRLFDEAITAELARTGYDEIVFDDKFSVFSGKFNVAEWHKYSDKKDSAKIAAAVAVGYAPKFSTNVENEEPEMKRRRMRRETDRIDHMRGTHKFEQVYHDTLMVLSDLSQLDCSPE